MHLLHLWVTEEQEEAIHLLFITNDWSFKKTDFFESVNPSVEPFSTPVVNTRTSGILQASFLDHAATSSNLADNADGHCVDRVTNTSHTCSLDHVPENDFDPADEKNIEEDNFLLIKDIAKQDGHHGKELSIHNADYSVNLGTNNEDDYHARHMVPDTGPTGRDIKQSDENIYTARCHDFGNCEVIKKCHKMSDSKCPKINVLDENATASQQGNTYNDGDPVIDRQRMNQNEKLTMKDVNSDKVAVDRPLNGSIFDSLNGNLTKTGIGKNRFRLQRETTRKKIESKLTAVVEHVSFSGGESPYRKKGSFYCELCNHSFKYRKSYDTHKAKDKCRHECHFCGKVFLYGTASNYKVHLQYHQKLKGHVCSTCGASFVEKGKLKEHLRKHSGTKHYVCDVCGQTFTGYANLYSHIKVHHTKHKDSLQCDKCPKRFKYMNGLKYHLKYYHREISIEMDSSYSCSVCEKAFKTPELLKRHETVHKDTRDFVCKVCGSAFVRIQGLSEHMKRHRKEYTCFCSVCGKGFYTRTTLKQHMLIHTGEKPYECQFCGFKCALKGNLTKHMKIHK